MCLHDCLLMVKKFLGIGFGYTDVSYCVVVGGNMDKGRGIHEGKERWLS